MNQVLFQATQQRRIVLFRYHGMLRSVEPHMYGLQSSSGREIVYGYQIGGLSDSRNLPSWRAFYVDEIEDLHATDAVFVPLPFNPRTPRLSEVFVFA